MGSVRGHSRQRGIPQPANHFQSRLTFCAVAGAIKPDASSRVCFRSAFGHPPARSRAREYSSDAYHHGSLPQQLGPV
jgi:hypothetical protein